MAYLPDFQLKELILRLARDAQPLTHQGHAIALYQDLAAITLQKRQDFCPVTTHLCNQGVSYAWGHPFCIVFKWDGKLRQIGSLQEACQVLGIENPQSAEPDNGDKKRQWERWQRVGGMKDTRVLLKTKFSNYTTGTSSGTGFIDCRIRIQSLRLNGLRGQISDLS